MRPQIGKPKFWEKPPKRESKARWAVITYLHEWNDPSMFEVQSKWVVQVFQDTDNLRMQINMHPDAELLMGNLKSHEEAIMWAKMME